MAGIELVDYPAVAPDDMQQKIDVFLKACDGVRDAYDDNQRRARLKIATVHAGTLLGRRQGLEQMLQDGDRWLASHPNDEEEAQWLAWEGEYRAIWDALRNGAQIAFGDAPESAQAHLFGIAS